jgi:hypothetical protein
MFELTKAAIRQLLAEQVAQLETEGRERYGGTPRLISTQQEAAYRLCHQDYFGLKRIDAAEVLGIDIRRLNEVLAEVRLNAPQLFPVLPPKAARIYSLFVHDNMTVAEIAEEMGTGVRTVQTVLRALYDNRERTGLYFKTGSLRHISYVPYMDKYLREKW